MRFRRDILGAAFLWAIGCLLLQAVVAVSSDLPTGRILFTRQDKGQDDLFVLELPKRSLQRLTDHPAKDSHGVPSPDGQRIVFNSERVGWWKIWIMHADGTSIEQLTNPKGGADYYPTWSPDGKQIVYVTGAEGNGDIVRMTEDGDDTVNLTHHPGRDNFPAWSPDGRWIAFASDRDGNWSIYLMHPDGSNLQRVTHEGDALEPAWFPDSGRLVYESNAEGDNRAFDLWTVIVAPDGSTGPPQRLTLGPGNNRRPAVSPDGRWITFESDRDDRPPLSLMPSRGGLAQRLTSDGYCYGASWFPAPRP